ncbi:MAG: MerR family transcriptional [Geobacteraceae bacterium]|nr:MAG: MerR family transcriptional [Geobacteraceae bacterium]
MEAGIPDKLFFKIGEVAGLTSLRPSVLRYWETEFDTLKPNKSRSGQRLYTRKEVSLIFEIKRLLYTEKLTIEGARKKIANRGKGAMPQGAVAESAREKIFSIISEVREDLERFKASL